MTQNVFAHRGLDRGEVWRLHEEGLSIAEIARKFNVTGPAIAYHLRRAPSFSNRASIREAIHNALRDKDDIDSLTLASTLRKAGYPFALHEVQHVLAALHQQGIITYIESKNGSHQTFRHIKFARPESPFEWAARVSETPETPTAPEPAVIDEPSKPAESAPEWPVLAELRAAQAARAEAQAKAQRYLDAAELLEAVDPTMAEELSAQADALVSGYKLTRAEAEYLNYATLAEEG